VRNGHLLAYGALGFPLAFAALPLYVHVPRLYAESFGFSLGLVGAVLLLVRLGDAVIDPWLGRWSDQASARHKNHDRRPQIIRALPLLGGGLLLLLTPPLGASILWLALTLVITFLGFSIITINYHAWGAELAENDHARTQVTAAREGFSLAGVVVAAALPALLGTVGTTATEGNEFVLGMQRTAWLFIPVLAIAALITLTRSPRTTTTGTPPQASLTAPLYDPVYSRLLAVLAASGIAAAIPATLVLFYIADVLQLAQWQGAFLALYFLAGAATLPFWVWHARRFGKVASWASSMALAILSFVWAFTLGPGDGLAFAVICAVSGMALGAELAVPPAILADRLARLASQGSTSIAAGSYFGLWNFVTKLNLALAAGIALPLVSLAGYKVGAGDTAVVAGGVAVGADEQGLVALALVYGLLPAVIKIGALFLLWHWRHHFAETKS
jgi:GPH family glycoside/pentoside/hexuronide:cation symporter